MDTPLYFTRLPKVIYADDFLIRDISRRFKVSDFIKNNYDAIRFYVIKEFESPEQLAQDFYGDPNLHWVILLTNDIADPFYDWVMPDDELFEYVKVKYGSDPSEYSAVHHYEKDGIRYIPPTDHPVDAVSVTNWEYEQSVNESKRTIKIIHPDLLPGLLEEMDTIITSGKNLEGAYR